MLPASEDRQFMTDTRSPEQRRHIMQSVKTRDTGPELAVRRIVWGLGYRYRLNAKGLPGRPDIVLPRYRKAIFVHGCFWHWHRCAKGNAPKSRLEYWKPKLAANRKRDRKRVKQLEGMGWSVLTVWQCETREPEILRNRLVSFLQGR